MNVLMISFTSLIQELYHGKPREIAKFPDVKLTVLVPPHWKELWSKQRRRLELQRADTYAIEVGKTFFTGNLHFSFFGGKMRELIKNLQPDIIDMEDEPFNTGSAQVVFLRNRLSPKSRIVMHASQSDVKKYPQPFRFFEEYSYRNVAAMLARNRDAVHVLQQKGYHGRVEIIPHGVDPSLFTHSRSETKALVGLPDRFVVGYIGALAEHKGLDTLLYAVRDLECDLLFIGDGPYRDGLCALAKKLNIEEKLHLLSPVPHREVPKYLAAMDVFVLPSRTMPNWREKFGRVLIEAMAAGVPVIGSDSGEIPSVVGDCGLIFPEGNIEKLRGWLRVLGKNPAERENMSARGKLKIQAQYSWEVIARNTYSVYQEVLRG